MDFAFSDEQEEFRTTLQRFFKRLGWEVPPLSLVVVIHECGVEVGEPGVEEGGLRAFQVGYPVPALQAQGQVGEACLLKGLHRVHQVPVHKSASSVHLDGQEALGIMKVLCFYELRDSLSPIRTEPPTAVHFSRSFVPPLGIVGRGDVAPGRGQDMGFVLEGDPAHPVVLTRPTRNGKVGRSP